MSSWNSKSRKSLQLLSLALLTASAAPASAKAIEHYALVGVVFEDGGEADGGFDWRQYDGTVPQQPQFINIDVETTRGTAGDGFHFVGATVCWDRQKRPVCAPGNNLAMYMEWGNYGQPGYHRFQFGTYFAPNASSLTGVFNPSLSYEMSCTQVGCFTRRIVSGRIKIQSIAYQ